MTLNQFPRLCMAHAVREMTVRCGRDYWVFFWFELSERVMEFEAHVFVLVFYTVLEILIKS